MGLPVTASAAGVAVGLGQDDAVHPDLFVEGLGHVDGVLAGHRVHHQQGLVHRHRLLDVDQFVHQDLVDLQPAGGIQDDDVVAVVLGVGEGAAGDLGGLGAVQGKDLRPGLAAHHLQLLDGGGAVDIAGHQQRPAALLEIVLGQFGGVGGLAVALQAAEHQDGLALVLDIEAGGFLAAHEVGQLFVDDLDHLLGGGQALHDLLAHGPLGHLIAEVLGHLVVDVGFQQGHAHLAHGGLDIGLGQFAVAFQLFEHAGKAVGQRFKCHVRLSFPAQNRFSVCSAKR